MVESLILLIVVVVSGLLTACAFIIATVGKFERKKEASSFFGKWAKRSIEKGYEVFEKK